LAVGLGSALLGFTVLKLTAFLAFGLIAFALSFVVGLLPSVERWPALRPLHGLLTLHFCVFSRIFFRAESLEAARQMTHSLLDFGSLELRRGLFRIEWLGAWVKARPELAWAEPIAEWGVLLLLIGGFAAHYVPSRSLESLAERLLPRVPAVVLGVGFAVLLGALGLVQAGPRANIYFAF
jgi:hypothetical protein